MQHEQKDISHKFIHRFSPPGQMDTMPFGSLVKVTNSETSDIYIQLSEDEMMPSWRKIMFL